MSGSLGDLGTFIPLLLGLARQGSVHFVPAVFFAGVFNVLTGLGWDAPMCVQPMKTIAAIGIAEGLPPQQVAVAGMLVSAMVLLLGLTRSIVVVGRLVPEPVILGMQLGLGISLNQKAFALIGGAGPATPSAAEPPGPRHQRQLGRAGQQPGSDFNTLRLLTTDQAGRRRLWDRSTRSSRATSRLRAASASS